MVKSVGFPFITSERKSSIEAAEKLGTRSEPLIMVVMNCLPDSANSHVIQAATPRTSNCNCNCK